MRVDFYQLGRDPAETVVALLAERTLAAGERLLVVSREPDQARRISEALWSHKPEAFLAHGSAGEGQESRQPILIANSAEPANGARYIAFADGTWRDPPEDCERAFLLFGEDTVAAARERWKALPPGERHFWRRGERGWEKVA